MGYDCIECGREIASDCKVCPRCGKEDAGRCAEEHHNTMARIYYIYNRSNTNFEECPYKGNDFVIFLKGAFVFIMSLVCGMSIIFVLAKLFNYCAFEMVKRI